MKSMTRRQLHFRCPVAACYADLLPGRRANLELVCSQGHTVDVASEGHVNLVPSGRRRRQSTVNPGDDDAMVRARRAFFEAGGYTAQASAVAQAVARAIRQSPPAHVCNVLDAGCGEGRYLRAIDNHRLAAACSDAGCHLWGTDISKLAVRLAAKKHPGTSFAVAKSHRLPFADGVLDVVLSVFAPVAWTEFRRVLRPGGAIVVARGGADHLYGLKKFIYTNARPQESPAWASRHGPSSLEHSVRCRTNETFEGAAAANLLAMTPFFWKATREQQTEIGTAGSGWRVETPVDFVLSTYRV